MADVPKVSRATVKGVRGDAAWMPTKASVANALALCALTEACLDLDWDLIALTNGSGLVRLRALLDVEERPDE